MPLKNGFAVPRYLTYRSFSILLYHDIFNSSGPFTWCMPLPGTGFSSWTAPMERGGSPGKGGAHPTLPRPSSTTHPRPGWIWDARATDL